jgi:hypothetical protein
LLAALALIAWARFFGVWLRSSNRRCAIGSAWYFSASVNESDLGSECCFLSSGRFQCSSRRRVHWRPPIPVDTFFGRRRPGEEAFRPLDQPSLNRLTSSEVFQLSVGRFNGQRINGHCCQLLRESVPMVVWKLSGHSRKQTGTFWRLFAERA